MQNNQQQTTTRWGAVQQQQPTARVTTDSLAAGWEARSIQEALDEIARELGVRERVFPKWVIDGKHTESDARDRLQRMIKAAYILQTIISDPGLLNVMNTQVETPQVPVSPEMGT